MVVQAQLDTSLPQSAARPRWRWRDTDWDESSAEVNSQLQQRQVHECARHLRRVGDVDAVVREVSDSFCSGRPEGGLSGAAEPTFEAVVDV